MSRKKMAETLKNITEYSLKYYIDKLKQEGKIIRIGGDKGGYWKVL